MTDEQIIEKIGMQDASDASKQSMLDTIKGTVELRLMNTIGAVLTEDQVKQLEDMQNAGKNREEMFGWLGEQLADLNEMYDSALESYLDEFVERKKRLAV